MHDVDEARRQVGFRQQLAELDGVVRCFLAGLDHDGVAGDQGGSGLAGDQKEREIPGQDAADYSDGLAEKEDGFAGTVAFEDLALDAAPPLRHVIQVVGGKGNFHTRQAQRLALFLGDDARNRFDISRIFAAKARSACALVGRSLRPAALGRVGCGDRRIHIRRGCSPARCR